VWESKIKRSRLTELSLLAAPPSRLVVLRLRESVTYRFIGDRHTMLVKNLSCSKARRIRLPLVQTKLCKCCNGNVAFKIEKEISAFNLSLPTKCTLHSTQRYTQRGYMTYWPCVFSISGTCQASIAWWKAQTRKPNSSLMRSIVSMSSGK
jgi:hypothetical protein